MLTGKQLAHIWWHHYQTDAEKKLGPPICHCNLPIILLVEMGGVVE